MTYTQETKIEYLTGIAEHRGWLVIDDGEGYDFQRQHAREDFGFYVQADTAEKLRDEIVDYYESFDPVEYAESRFGEMNTYTLYVADEIEEWLKELAVAVTRALDFLEWLSREEDAQ